MASLWQSFVDSPDYSKESPLFPNPFICVRDLVVTGTREAVNRLPWNGVQEWLNGSWYWISRSNYNDPAVVYLPLLIAVGLTFLRLFLDWLIFKVCHDLFCIHFYVGGFGIIFSVYRSGTTSLKMQQISFQRVSGSQSSTAFHALGVSIFLFRAL